jgi:serine/threonine protein kinase
MALSAGDRLGPYEILAPLGAGGMGEVYRARDARLNRDVAIKISAAQFSERFEREAKAIAALNHPNICQIYDVGPDYLVMEHIEGVPIVSREKPQPRPPGEILRLATQIAAALRAAHTAGIIHRDLKPANIMVRCDGYVKVLDFGLAKRILAATEDTVTAGFSVPGQIMGTVAYMSPEQILGQEVDQRSDLFAFGIILYEMIAGRHPWPGNSAVDTMHAILHDQPPPLEAALGGVVDKLLRKNREERYSSAEMVLEDLARPAFSQSPPPRPLTRLIVLPFRILRRHEASDFLSVSLPEAIASSLAAINSLVVRSMLVASRFATSNELDVKLVAEQAQVDAILTGTILSDSEQLRVHTQLVEAPAGTVLWSNTSQVPMRDIFQLQDDLVDRIIQSLTLPLTARERHALKHDVPASAISYELYLRANQRAGSSGAYDMVLARDLYLRSLEADPNFAPAWACLGRAYRFLGKFAGDHAANLTRAEEAFRKAFALNPELALAHNFYTALETDLGRSLDAMERLLKRAETHRNDPNELAGLVQACRYCGLLEASLAAHRRAKQLDPDVRTSVAYTHFRLGDFKSALEYCSPMDAPVLFPSYLALGRKQDGISIAREAEKTLHKQLIPWAVAYRACLEDDRQTALEALNQALELRPMILDDPEFRFSVASLLAKLNDPERALEFLSIALDRGYRCHYALLHDLWLDSLRSHPQFIELVNRAASMDSQARAVFLDNGGDRLLGSM